MCLIEKHLHIKDEETFAGYYEQSSLPTPSEMTSRHSPLVQQINRVESHFFTQKSDCAQCFLG